jgi:hypothetical protein
MKLLSAGFIREVFHPRVASKPCTCKEEE